MPRLVCASAQSDLGILLYTLIRVLAKVSLFQCGNKCLFIGVTEQRLKRRFLFDERNYIWCKMD